MTTKGKQFRAHTCKSHGHRCYGRQTLQWGVKGNVKPKKGSRRSTRR